MSRGEEPVPLDEARLLDELGEFIQILRESVSDRPMLYICANTEALETFEAIRATGHQILYLRQDNERLCPDCGQESLTHFVVSDAYQPFGEFTVMRDEITDRDTQLYNQILTHSNTMLAANPLVLLRCPHTGTESVARCPPGTRHQRYYPGRRVGDTCPDCLHTTLS
jgi:hypothetical protein